ncbi:MAG: ABC transporter ATP-binding protein, partial [Bacteroidota bacterium]
CIEEGELYLNDIPFNNYQRHSLFSQIGVSLPINQIFEGTFKENILLGRKISNKSLNQTIKLLRLEKYLIHQPLGIDGFVDSGGRRLPRSIIQKLLIARILVGEPRLLLMEDPMQFIAEDEKKRIIDYIMHKDRKWTVLVISDYYYWKEKGQRVIQMDDL